MGAVRTLTSGHEGGSYNLHGALTDKGGPLFVRRSREAWKHGPEDSFLLHLSPLSDPL